MSGLTWVGWWDGTWRGEPRALYLLFGAPWAPRTAAQRLTRLRPLTHTTDTFSVPVRHLAPFQMVGTQQHRKPNRLSALTELTFQGTPLDLTRTSACIHAGSHLTIHKYHNGHFTTHPEMSIRKRTHAAGVPTPRAHTGTCMCTGPWGTHKAPLKWCIRITYHLP